MKSKAEYLSKYLSAPTDAKKKKKKKPTSLSNIVVDAAAPSVKHVALEDLLDEEEEAEDLKPIKVELKSTKEFKGFKRIDGQEIKLAAPAVAVEAPEPPEQATVYRDASGRIVDLEARRAEFEAQKQQQADEKAVTEVRMTEEEQIRQSKESFKPKQQDIDDPILVFEGDTTSKIQESQYTYRQGVNPVNRFRIGAGCLWDGIDRSNGFEDLVMRKTAESRFRKIDSKINESYDDYEI